MHGSKRANVVSLLIVSFLFVSFASTALALPRLACANRCTPECPCELACVDDYGGFTTTCGEAGYQCVPYFAQTTFLLSNEANDLTTDEQLIEQLNQLAAEAPALLDGSVTHDEARR